MARYYFNFENDESIVADLIGRDLPDALAARTEAAKVAADLATDHALEGKPLTYRWIEVVDDCRRPIVRLPLVDVIREPNRRR